MGDYADIKFSRMNMEYKPEPYRSNFLRSDATTKEEKLLVELSNSLHEVTMAYIRLNRESCSDHEIFVTIRDGALGYAGSTIRALVKCMVMHEQKIQFVQECLVVFGNYIEEIEEKLRKENKE